MTHSHAARTTRHRLACAGLFLALSALAACSSAKATPAAVRTSAPALAHTVAGDLDLTNGYVTQPASPDVAAAYVTITNTGSTAHTLKAVTSNVSDMVMPMNETDSNGVGSMTDLSSLQIAPHSSFSFAPGRAHLMLEKPNRDLRAGDSVTLSMKFSGIYPVRIHLPVVPVTGP